METHNSLIAAYESLKQRMQKRQISKRETIFAKVAETIAKKNIQEKV